MKTFLLRFISFIVLILLILLVFETYISLNKKKLLSEEQLEGVYQENINSFYWVNEKYKNKEVVLLSGSSTVKYGFNNNILNNNLITNTKFVNIGNDAGDPIEAYLIIKNIKGPKIKAIYLGLDPWIYTRIYYRYRKKIMYLDFNTIQSLMYSYQYNKRTMVIRSSKILKSITDNKKNKSIENKFFSESVNIDTTEAFSKNFGTLDPTEQFMLNTYGWSDIQFVYLNKIYQFCLSKNIECVLFYPPKLSSYSDTYFSECKDVHVGFEYKINEIFHNGLIKGSFNIFSKDYDTLYFQDEVHLSTEGRKEFTNYFLKNIYQE